MHQRVMSSSVNVWCWRDRHTLEPCPLCRTKALRTEQDAVAAVVGEPPHNNGLKDAPLSDVVGELGNLFVWKLRSRIGRILVEPIYGHEEGLAFGGKSVK